MGRESIGGREPVPTYSRPPGVRTPPSAKLTLMHMAYSSCPTNGISANQSFVKITGRVKCKLTPGERVGFGRTLRKEDWALRTKTITHTGVFLKIKSTEHPASCLSGLCFT